MSQRLQIRFGYGTGPRVTAKAAAEILGSLERPDRMLTALPTPATIEVLRGLRAVRRARRDQDARRSAQAQLRKQAVAGARAHLARKLDGRGAFRERLVAFWGDHFTVAGGNLPLRAVAAPYLDDAIRPHVAGRFADMLTAVVTHPAMLHYLNQSASFGPNSPAGRQRGRGLNENLAREVLELHTLGVSGAYGQADVRELAELMTGLSLRLTDGFHFVPAMAEPGAETVLGRVYGGAAPRLADVVQAMEDLARHPDTLRHLARKLAVHFTSDQPDPDLLRALEDALRRHDGALQPVYEVLLDHPATLASFGEKAKQPIDYIMSALVALGAGPKDLMDISGRDFQQGILRPAAQMGQPLFQPSGPDGWPEEAAYWITPQALATRVLWSLEMTGRLSDRLPDPERVLGAALGPLAHPALTFAVGAAETRADAVALILASAEFNRR